MSTTNRKKERGEKKRRTSKSLRVQKKRRGAINPASKRKREKRNHLG